MPENNPDLDHLEALARERWGDEWTMRITRWADGDQQAIVVHSVGVVDDSDDGKILEKERIQSYRDGSVRWDRVHERKPEVVDVRESERLDES